MGKATGMLKDIMNNDLPLSGGVIGGHMLVTKLATNVPWLKDNPKFHPVLAIVGGIALRHFVKTPMVKQFASGMVAYGGASLVGKFIPDISINGMDEDTIEDVINDVINAGGRDIAKQYGEIGYGDDDDIGDDNDDDDDDIGDDIDDD